MYDNTEAGDDCSGGMYDDTRAGDDCSGGMYSMMIQELPSSFRHGQLVSHSSDHTYLSLHLLDCML